MELPVADAACEVVENRLEGYVGVAVEGGADFLFFVSGLENAW